MSYQSNQKPEPSRKNMYTGFIFFIVLIALVIAVSVFMVNHNGIYNEVIYEQKLKELEEKSTLTITHDENTLKINTKKSAKMKIMIDDNAYEFKLTEGDNEISFAIYDSPEPMLSINNKQNGKQNYLHAIAENSKLEIILPSELSLNLQENSEKIIIGQLESEAAKTMIQAEFTVDEATNEN